MNRLAIAFTIATTLLFVQSCSSASNIQETMASSTTEHNERAAADANHDGHGMVRANDGEKKTATKAKLTTPDKIAANTSVGLAIEIRDSNGNAIANFDTFQEELMHLIVVSDDLQSFAHLHPVYKSNGRFEVEARFPKPGSYTFFSDYKPTGQQERVSVLKTRVSGDRPPAVKMDVSRTKTFADTKVNLELSEATVKAGEEVTLMFDLQDAANNKPIADLQPYLGEKGHLVILRQSSPLTSNDYVHAHALKDTPPGQVHFATRFPRTGQYKLWGQFNRNGKIVTADFWVNVADSSS